MVASVFIARTWDIAQFSPRVHVRMSQMVPFLTLDRRFEDCHHGIQSRWKTVKSSEVSNTDGTDTCGGSQQ